MAASPVSKPDAGAKLAEVSLDNRLQSQSGGRLRHLAVEFIGGRVRITAVAPSYHVRQLAKRAALTFFPADQLDLAIKVLPAAESNRKSYESAGFGRFELTEIGPGAF